MVESLLYHNSTTPTWDDVPRLGSVTLRRKEGQGDWSTVGGATYAHYGNLMDPASAHGSLGDLKTVSAFGAGAGTACVTAYRYYKGGGSSSSSGGGSSSSGGGVGLGEKHLLKYVLNPASYERFVADGHQFSFASDAVVAQYADFYFEYDDKRRVTREIVQGGSRSYTFEYDTSTHADDPNHWKFKTIENLPGGDRNIVYANHAGQVMLRELESGANSWVEYYQYDSDFRITLAAQASAISGYSEGSDDLAVSLKSADGLIHLLGYDAGSGELSSHSIKRGSSGTPIKLWEREFGSHTEVFSSDSSSSSSAASGSSSSSSSSRPPQCPVPRRTVYALSKQIDYPDDVDQTKKIETSFSYTWHNDTVQVRERTTTLPVIPTSQNGPGTAATRVEQFDRFGHPTWLKDERGFITYFEFQAHSGGLLKRIDDVDDGQLAVPAGWSTPAGGGLHLVTDYEVDGPGRVTQELGPSHTVDIGGVATAVRRAAWNVYKDCNTEVRHGQGYATGTAPNYTYTLVNPVSITKLDKSGNVTEEISATRSDTSGKLTAGDSFPQTSYVRWTTHQYTECCKLASTRLYHLIPDSGAGTEGNNYSQTNFGYDIRNRRNRVVSPGGTITKQIFEARGLPTQILVGTSDANLVAVADYEYDSAADGGDGNLTKETQHVDGVSGNDRVTVHAHDWRNRRTSTDGEIDFYQKSYFDNFGRVTKSERYDTTSGGNLIARSETKYDDLGRVFRTVSYAVNPATGSVGNSLTDDTWYDASGHVIKHFPAGSKAFSKSVFDGLGRETKQYVGYDTAESSYTDAGSVTGDTIFEQVETLYDAASNVIQTTVRRRFHDATGTGELTSPSGSQPKARVSHTALYPDAVGRQQAVADYGTNGGSAFSRPSTVPARSDSVLVTTTEYNSDGEGFKTIDPMATQTRQEFDAAGRQTKLIENYIDGDPATGTSDEDRTTISAYNADGQVKTLTAKNPTTGDQVTKYVYGSTLAESGIASSQLLRAMIYPDSDDQDSPLGNGPDGIYDRVEYKYNRQGERVELKDQRETVHVYDHDKLGRLVHDRVTELGSPFGTPVFSSSSSGSSSSSSSSAPGASSSSSSSGPGDVVDGSVRRISRTYEVRGMVEHVSSHDNPTVGAGNVVNDVEFVYNTFGQLVTEYQEHGGAVNVSTTPKVQYAYANGSANHVRRTSMTYPNGRVVTLDYGTAGGAGDNLSRVHAIKDGATELALYSYLGLSDFVQVDYTEPDIRMDLAHGLGADPYDGGLDRFDRVIDLLWRKYSGLGEDVERVKHGYDRASNRLWRENTVAKAQVPPVNQDELYGYDGLYQLKDFDRGALNAGKTAITGLAFAQEWSLDATGNWSNFKEDTDGNGSWDLDQPRTHNKANEVTVIGVTTGPNWVDPVHDRAGNMTTVPQPAVPTASYAATWDAWNRLVKLMDGAAIVGEYAFDGLARRVKRVVGGVTRDLFFSDQWRVIEERLGASSAAERQFVWGFRYIDDLVVRDHDADGSTATGNLGITGSGLEERLYALQDPAWNMTAVANPSGALQERYAYTTYGIPRFLTSAFAVRSDTIYDWETLFTGYRWDKEWRGYHVRRRPLHGPLGRWLGRDPADYGDGMSLYEYARNNAVIFNDPFGLVVIIPIVVGASCAACWGVAGIFFNTAHDICKNSENETEYLLCFISAIDEMESNLDWYSWSVINAACLACGGGLTGAAKKIGQKMGSKWAKKKAAEEARKKARKELLKRIAWCEAIHAQYTIAKKAAAGCLTSNDCDALKTKCIAAAAEIAGRTDWLHRDCDEICPGSLNRPGGSAAAEVGHRIQLRDRRKFAVKCCARMAAICGADAIDIPEIPSGIPATPPAWDLQP